MSTLQASLQPEAHATNRVPAWIKAHPLVAYFLLAFLGTWLVFSPIILSKNLHLFALPDAAAIGLFILSTFTGPFNAALITTAVLDGKPGLKKLFSRMVQWRVGFGWYLLLLLGYPVLLYAGITLIRGAGALANPLDKIPLLLSVYIPMILMNLIMPGIPEETGWRGFALPRLERAYGPLAGALILGTLHALWHLPVYIVPGMMIQGPFKMEFFIANSLAIIAATVIWTWLFNNARGSILFAILIHATSNASSAPIARLALTNLPYYWLGAEIFGAACILIILITRGKLAYDPEKMP